MGEIFYNERSVQTAHEVFQTEHIEETTKSWTAAPVSTNLKSFEKTVSHDSGFKVQTPEGPTL